MKPDEAMHAGAEEVELEPSAFFIDIATLIIEGRVPGFADKGFGEGPHCRPVHGQSRHICDFKSPDCQQYEELEKHMLLLWKNGIPMSIEVLLYPDCCQPEGQRVQVETSSVPETSSCTLLEQWTLHMPQRRIADAIIVPRGLLQAVRSFLHFSQLSAWLSLGKGKITTNIHYRICVPGEVFSTKFKREPDSHIFPVANAGRSHAMKVMVRSLPRQGEFPKVPCIKHGIGLVQSPIASGSNEGIFGLESSGFGEFKARGPCARNFDGAPLLDSTSKEFFENFRKSPGLKRSALPDASANEFRVNTPVGSKTSLGDCLLDPPQSLHMYPKRYQSPARSGSPNVEVPEHLMFGLGVAAASSSKLELKTGHFHPTPKSVMLPAKGCVGPKDRSRPHRKPVVDMFKKEGLSSTPVSTTNRVCDRLNNIDQTKKQTEDTCKNPNLDSLLTSKTVHYRGKYPPELLGDGKLEGEEMRMVLDNLSKRYPASKLSMMSELEENRQNSEPFISQSYLLNSIKLKKFSPEEVWKIKEDSNKVENLKQCKNSVEKQSSLSKDNQWFRDHLLHGNVLGNTTAKLLSKEEVQVAETTISFPSSPSVLSPLYQNHSNTSVTNINQKKVHNCNTKPCSPLVKSPNLELLDHNESNEVEMDDSCNISEEMENDYEDKKSEYPNSLQQYKNNPETPKEERSDHSIKNVLLNNSQSINASKRILGRNFAYLYYKMLKCNINLPRHDDDTCAENPDRNGHLIPSAAEKLKFRRSLDSATCMVFHQNTGLPLTSSPAPIRKSGTCFDFDSSLTSVAAIKKALFEKDPELDEETKRLISSSAPASTTTSNLLGNFEESVLNGRLEPVSTVEGFTAEIGASGSFCPRHKTLPVTVFFYTLHDIHNKVTSPYLGHINLGRKGYNIPKIGTVQVTLFNPHRTVVKMFVVRYDLSDMPPCSQTFLRQRTLYMPTGASEDDEEARKWLRYLIHLRFASSKSGKIYLHTDIRMIVFRKSDLDAATIHGQRPYELRSFTQGPKNPKFSPCK